MLFGLLSVINSNTETAEIEQLATPMSFAVAPYPTSAPTGLRLTWADLNETLRRFLRHRIFGSSTAAGSGASNSAHRCTNLYRDSIISEGYTLAATYDNIALGGYTTYHYRETGYTPPSGRPSPDPDHNITKLMSLGATDIAICMNGGNDVVNAVIGGYTNAEIQANYIAMDTQLTAAGIKFFPTTLFPRTGATYAQRQRIEFLSNWILSYFGDRAINLFEMLVWRTPSDTSTDLTAKVEYRYLSDETHFNDYAHGLIADKLIEHVGAYINSTAKILRYDVYRSTSSGSGYTLIGTANPLDLYYQDDTAAVNTEYFYKIKAKALSGYLDSEFSDIHSSTKPGEVLLQTIKINLGTNTAAAPWVNPGTAMNSAPIALNNILGAASGITARGSGFATAANGVVPYTGLGPSFPNDVMSNSFSSTTSKTMTFTGNPGKKYKLRMIGSRSSIGGIVAPRQTVYTIGSESYTVECWQNSSVTVDFTTPIPLNGSNQFVLTIAPGLGGNSYVNGIILEEWGTP